MIWRVRHRLSDLRLLKYARWYQTLSRREKSIFSPHGTSPLTANQPWVYQHYLHKYSDAWNPNFLEEEERWCRPPGACHLPRLKHSSSYNKSILGDIRLWVGPRSKHLLSTWDLTANQPWVCHLMKLGAAQKSCGIIRHRSHARERTSAVKRVKVVYIMKVGAAQKIFRRTIDAGRVPREQKMLKGHLPRVIYHQVY